MKERMALFRRISVLITIATIILAALAVTASAQDGDENGDEKEAMLFGLGILALIAVCAVIALLIAVAIAVWLYKDAEKRGKSGVLWVILLLVGAFLGNLIGVIIVIVVWLVVRPPEMPPGVYRPPPQQPYYPPQQPGYPPQQPPQYPPQQPPGGY